jgi:hypothetical protein
VRVPGVSSARWDELRRGVCWNEGRGSCEESEEGGEGREGAERGTSSLFPAHAVGLGHGAKASRRVAPPLRMVSSMSKCGLPWRRSMRVNAGQLHQLLTLHEHALKLKRRQRGKVAGLELVVGHVVNVVERANLDALDVSVEVWRYGVPPLSSPRASHSLFHTPTRCALVHPAPVHPSGTLHPRRLSTSLATRFQTPTALGGMLAAADESVLGPVRGRVRAGTSRAEYASERAGYTQSRQEQGRSGRVGPLKARD